ncbi:hypothetical protein F5B17DRAFT_429684 [Nemania serpens]|nr:hypothetical protein F5B17DRAFT_429684 [Nemania serpens]
MAVRLQYGVLIDEMKTFDTTNGWDVIVSYDEGKINSLLRTVKGHGPTQFPDMEVEAYDPVNDEMVKTVYRLKVSNPVLQFRSDRGSADLEYDLSGDFGPKPTFVPPNTKMTLHVEIANLEGTTTTDDGDSGFKPTLNQLHPQPGERYKQAPNYVTSVGENVTRGICLVFRDTTVKVTNPSTDAKVQAIINRLRADITTATADHLDKSTYYYFIAGLNTPQRRIRNSTMVTLQPKSFCFTLLAGDAQLGLPGTLVMWIGVEGGNHNGQQPGGSTSLTFHPDTRDVNPVPLKNTASIIFSHDLIAREFIKKALEDRFDEVNILTRKGQEGMELSGKMRNKRIYIPTRNDRTDGAVAFVLDYFEGVDFTPSTPETRIKIQSKISTSNADSSSVTVTYKSDEKKVNWRQERFSPDFHSVKTGVVNLKFALDGVGWWKGGDRNQIHLVFRRDNDIKVDASAEKPPWWAPTGSGQLPEHYEKLTMTLDLDIAMGSLDYFLTTNLLFPGQHVFIADSPTPDADYNHGLGVPRDLILTGQVTDKLE